MDHLIHIVKKIFLKKGKLFLNGIKKKSKTIMKNLNPKFNETFRFEVTDTKDVLRIEGK
jgi:Ca2+-dependent lipid-binding protein